MHIQYTFHERPNRNSISHTLKYCSLDSAANTSGSPRGRLTSLNITSCITKQKTKSRNQENQEGICFSNLINVSNKKQYFDWCGTNQPMNKVMIICKIKPTLPPVAALVALSHLSCSRRVGASFHLGDTLALL